MGLTRGDAISASCLFMLRILSTNALHHTLPFTLLRMSLTRFVPSNGRITAQSYQPCHVFGDSDIYGVGVRCSFYIQYSAAIIALWYNLSTDITSIRFGLTVVALALFINLCINSTSGHSLVVVDWTIALQLIGFIPVYAFWKPMFFLFVYLDADVSLTTMFLDAFFSADREQGNTRPSRKQDVNTSYKFLYIAALALEVSENASEYNEAVNLYNSAVTSFLQSASFAKKASPTLDNILKKRLGTNIDPLGTLRNVYIEILAHIHLQYRHIENEDITQAKSESTRQAEEDELKIRRLATLQADHIVLDHLKSENYKLWQMELITLAIITLTWAAYLCATPWIYFKAIENGRKEGCDIKLRTFPIFAAVSAYNKGYRIWLRFCACVSVITGAVVTILAGWMLIKGLAYRWKKNEKKNPWTSKDTLLSDDMRKALLPSREQVKESSKDTHEGVEDSRKVFHRFYGTLFCTVTLVMLIILVELTVTANRIDLSASPLSTTSQLLPFVIACFIFISVLFHCVEEERTRRLKDGREKTFMDAAHGRLKELKTVVKKKYSEGNEDKSKGKHAPKEAMQEMRAEEGQAGPASEAHHA